MDQTTKSQREATRLESLWAGEFGDAYLERNRDAGATRGPFWNAVLDEFAPRTVLEVGCNVGANIRWLATRLHHADIYGVDINTNALAELRQKLPEVNVVWSAARDLPFRDRRFDLVFTMGVLIHQPDATLPLVMSEIVRCSRRYILCGEYHADGRIEVPYRGQRDALIKRDFGRIYQELFPELVLRRQGFLSRDEGWDSVTYWMFERP